MRLIKGKWIPTNRDSFVVTKEDRRLSAFAFEGLMLLIKPVDFLLVQGDAVKLAHVLDLFSFLHHVQTTVVSKTSDRALF
jgi:hypothetical protein